MSLEERRIANVGKQVDNARLPAGSNMYYYCRTCGAPTVTKPEGWWEDPPPPKQCDDCVTENVEINDNYDDWLQARGERPVPR